jgi:hypothetical protein
VVLLVKFFFLVLPRAVAEEDHLGMLSTSELKSVVMMWWERWWRHGLAVRRHVISAAACPITCYFRVPGGNCQRLGESGNCSPAFPYDYFCLSNLVFALAYHWILHNTTQLSKNTKSSSIVRMLQNGIALTLIKKLQKNGKRAVIMTPILT